ncbi:MAG: hypothetical protein KJ587_08730 [Alphaproteobacteria bacterium]|nr:hypothetical protein [Alphaproteobacteria bacterium]
MSTLTHSATWLRDELDTISKAASGALKRISAHRQAKADAFVRPYLARLSEKELAELGFRPAEITKIKAAGDESLPAHL